MSFGTSLLWVNFSQKSPFEKVSVIMKNNGLVALRVVVFLILALADCLSVFADEAFNFFVEACRHSGYNPAEIATFQADIKFTSAIAFPNSSIKVAHESFHESIENSKRTRLEESGMSQQQVQREIEETRKRIPLEMFQKILSSNTQTNYSKVFVRNPTSPVELSDFPAQVSMKYQDGRLSLYSCGSKGVNSYHSTDDGRIIKMNKEEPTMYHLAGRTQSPMTLRAMKLLLSGDGKGSFVFSAAGISAFKKDCEINKRTFILPKEKEKYDANHYASVLEVYEKGELCERFWIDSKRGYICPKVQIYEPGTRKISTEIFSENFIFDEHSQKWFPEKCSTDEAKEDKEVTNCWEFSIIPGTLVLNRPIPDSAFVLTVQADARIHDLRHGTKDTVTYANVFIADQTGTLDLPTIEEKSLEEVEWLAPGDAPRAGVSYPIETRTISWTQIVLMTVGIIMIILGLYLHFSKKRNNS